MAWETRERGTRYYTRSYRDEDGRVVREYIGGGAWLDMRAQLWPGARDTHARDVDRFFAGQARDPVAALIARDETGLALLEQADRLAAPVSELCETADVLLQAHLVAAGYARHKGEWRLKRG